MFCLLHIAEDKVSQSQIKIFYLTLFNFSSLHFIILLCSADASSSRFPEHLWLLNLNGTHTWFSTECSRST